jgi:hypothetical protein
MQVEMSTLLNPGFQASLSKLRSHPNIKASVSWKLLPVNKKIEEAYKDFDKVRRELCEKYAAKDEAGEFILIAAGEDQEAKQFVFDVDNDKLFKEEFKALGDAKLELPEPAVKVSDLGGITITVDDLMQLVGPVLLDS